MNARHNLAVVLLAITLAACATEHSDDKSAAEKEPANEPVTSQVAPLFPVERNEVWGYVNSLGEIVIRLQFSYADSFSEGLAVVRIGGDSGKLGYIDQRASS